MQKVIGNAFSAAASTTTVGRRSSSQCQLFHRILQAGPGLPTAFQVTGGVQF